MKVCGRVYYDKKGDIILITNEREGNVVNTAKEEDLYGIDVNINDINYLVIEYGKMLSIFSDYKSASVKNNKLVVIYNDNSSKEFSGIDTNDSVINDTNELQERLIAINEYILDDDNNVSIDDIENFILEKEMEGMM